MGRGFLIPVRRVVPPLLLAIFAAGQGWSGEVHAQGCTELTNNMVIKQHTTFCARAYSFDDQENDGVIIIVAHDIHVNGNGLTLDGRSKSGYGIYLNGYTGVTLRNVTVHS